MEQRIKEQKKDIDFHIERRIRESDIQLPPLGPYSFRYGKLEMRCLCPGKSLCEAGRHVRTAVDVNQLPMDVTAGAEGIFEVIS